MSASVSKKPSIVVITGPTASGKSKLALEIAAKNGGEIINADSVQIYRGFDIGSAKPSSAELASVPHHLISQLEPTDEFNAGIFRKLASKKIEEITARDRLPIVVGGTGLYIQSLLSGLLEIKGEIGDARRLIAEKVEFLEGEDEESVQAELHEWLMEMVPATASRLNPRDKARVRRALEVRLATGEPWSALCDTHGMSEHPFRTLVIALLPSRQDLYRACDQRVDLMLEQGLVNEVEELRRRFNAECRPLGAIGYRHIGEFLNGQYDLPQAVEEMKRDTRRYVKRQFTWWRNQPEKLAWRDLSGEFQGKESVVFLEQLHDSIQRFRLYDPLFSEEEPNIVRIENFN